MRQVQARVERERATALQDHSIPLELRLAVDVRQRLVSLAELAVECGGPLGLAQRPLAPGGGLRGRGEAQVHLALAIDSPPCASA